MAVKVKSKQKKKENKLYKDKQIGRIGKLYVILEWQGKDII